MGIINFFKRLLGIEEKEIEYPDDFAIVDFSAIALRKNIRDDQNKIIYRYFNDGYGNVILKKYRYDKQRLKALQEIHSIPIFDKTRQEPRFPVFGKILPSEIEYTTKE